MYPLLHATLNVGSLVLKNRLVLPPMATEKSAKGQVTNGLVAYYGDMARSGPGLIIQEHSFVSPEGRASANQVSLAADADIPGLQRLTAAVHAQGVPILAQISHAGSAAHRAITGQEVISASAVSNPSRAASVQGQPEFPREMTQGDIQRIVQAFVDAAVRAQQAGYDGVEIHSAHGYLLDQFYSPVTNKRTDDYTGQTLAGRTRLHVEIIQAIRRQVGSDFALSLRLGGSDYMDGGAVVGDVSEAAKIFETAGIDMLSLSGGMSVFFRPGHTEAGYFAELSAAAKKGTTLPVLLTGGIADGAEAEAFLEKDRPTSSALAGRHSGTTRFTKKSCPCRKKALSHEDSAFFIYLSYRLRRSPCDWRSRLPGFGRGRSRSCLCHR